MNTNDALERLSTIYERQLLPAQAVAEAMSIYLEMGDRIAELDAESVQPGAKSRSAQVQHGAAGMRR